MLSCSLCIPTYKRPDALNNLLSAVIGMNDPRIAEVLIAISYDKGNSIDNTTLHLLRMMQIQGIPYTVESNLSGLIDAKLWFAENATKDILLVVDDDGLFPTDYLRLLNHFKDPDVAAVSGTIQTPLEIGYYKEYSYEAIDNPPSGTLCNKIEVDETGLVVVADKYQVYMLKKPEVYLCECLVGTAMFIRKEWLKPDFLYSRGACNYEEYDYTYAAYRAGKKLLFDSGRIAYHLHLPTGGMRGVEKQKRENSDYFKQKFQL